MSAAAPPLLYEPSVEVPELDEAKTGEQLSAVMRGIQERTLANGGCPLRAVHAKCHALLRGELHVEADLPPPLAQGLFAGGSSHPVVMRWSTSPGDLLHDGVSVPRGVAIKIIGVQGARLADSDGDTTQDFLLVNSPAFVSKSGKRFLRSAKLLAATTDKAPRAKRLLSSVLRRVERAIEALGTRSATLVSLGGQALVHPAGDLYFSQTPLLHGLYMAKLSLAPLSPRLIALQGAPLDTTDDADALRHAMNEVFTAHAAEWELRVQLCTDLAAMPIEDATQVWPEERSPFVRVARIVVPPQPAWDAARADASDRRLSFSPWHGLAAHRPLGSINRLRQQVYANAQHFRAQHSGGSLAQPRSVDELGF
jgi:hypothetical protein